MSTDSERQALAPKYPVRGGPVGIKTDSDKRAVALMQFVRERACRNLYRFGKPALTLKYAVRGRPVGICRDSDMQAVAVK